jgi:ankyrin repeat protein
MANMLKSGYNYIRYFFDYITTVWPVTWLYTYRSIEASSDSMNDINQIVKYLYQHQKGECDKSISEISQQIKTLNFHEDILSVRDEMYGLNLLQHAIIVNNKDIVELLISNIQIPSQVECNSVTHMAAFLGHLKILETFITERPFDMYKRAGLCYPALHEPVSYYRRMGFMFQEKYRCEEEKLLPIEWAIVGDHLNCVEEMVKKMEEMGGRQFNLTKFLHFAASRGAEKCLDYFVKRCPDKIDHVGKTGDVPLLEAVVWGRQCAKVLIDNGADVNRVAVNGDTALHRLYRNDIDGIFAIYDTTKYLLTTGIEQLINTINLKGETALHLLVTHVSYIGGNYYHPEQRSMPRWQMQPNYQEQVIQTIKLLLSFNADPLIFDSLQLQPLNKLLHVTMKASRPHDLLECVQGCINSKYVYRNDFTSLSRAIEILIENGAEVNTQCAIGHTPLILLIQTLLNTEVPDLVQQSDSILTACDLLLKNGAKCNYISEDKKTCCSLLAELAKKMLKRPAGRNVAYVEQDFELKKRYADLVNNILVMFLKHGLNPNYTTTKKSPHLSGGSGNGLIEFVRLTVCARNGDDFKMIHMWLRTLLQWGADPDIESYPSDPIICHSQSSIFLKKQSTQPMSHFIHEIKELQAIFELGHAEELLLLFYKTMDHKVLHDCLSTASFMARFHPMGATGKSFLTLLTGMSEHPRSLKQMCRVSIHKAMNRRLAVSVDQLPLPNALKKYVLDIE